MAAVVEEDGAYRIDQESCVTCDACREQAPYAIGLIDKFGVSRGGREALVKAWASWGVASGADRLP